MRPTFKPKIVVKRGWGGGWQCHLTIGVQGFDISAERDTKREAEFMARMIRKALANFAGYVREGVAHG